MRKSPNITIYISNPNTPLRDRVMNRTQAEKNGKSIVAATALGKAMAVAWQFCHGPIIPL
jgi:cytochrome c biogenesis protein CcdA